MNKYSSRVTQPRSQGASQAMLYGIGLTDGRPAEAAGRHLQHVVRGQHLQHAPRSPGGATSRQGVQAAGLVGLRFNTIGVSDGLSMGTDGMSYSLPSRDLIADSIETVMGAQWYDALVTVPGCDKNMPGQRHRDGAAQPAVADGLRRHDPRRPRAGQAARHHLGVPVLRRVPRRRRSPTSSGSTSSSTRARARAPAAACTPPTRWPWRSRRWACRCRTARRMPADDPGKADECRRAGAAVRAAARARPQAARHPDARSRSRTRSRW